MDSDATLILNVGALDGGTLLTTNICQWAGKPYLIVELETGHVDDEVSRARAWLQTNTVGTLNVAGPRETKRPGAHQAARDFLSQLAGDPANRPLERGDSTPIDRYPMREEQIAICGGPPPPGLLSAYSPPPPYRVRRLLVERYAGGLLVTEGLAAETAARVGRASPAFIKELMRRAAQAMLERGGDEVLEAHDVDRALADMLGAGGRFAARMLGAEAAIGFADVA